MLYLAVFGVRDCYGKLLAIETIGFGAVNIVIPPLSPELSAPLLRDHEAFPALGVAEFTLFAALQVPKLFFIL